MEGLKMMMQALTVSPNGVLITDATLPGNPILYVNEAWQRITGYEFDEVFGKSAGDFLKSRIGLPNEEELIQAVSERREFHGQVQPQRKDGTSLWCDVTLTPVFDTQGQLIHFIEFIEDLSRQKNVENVMQTTYLGLETEIFNKVFQLFRFKESLRRSEMHLHRLIEANVLGIVFASSSGVIRAANDAFIEMLGYQESTDFFSEGLTWLELSPPENRQKDEEAIQSLQSFGTVAQYEKQFCKRCGARIDVLFGGVLLDKEQDQAIFYILNISGQKEVERHLQETLAREQLLRRIIGMINETTDLRLLIKTIQKEIGVFCKVDRCFVRLYEEIEDGLTLRLADEIYYSDDTIPRLKEEDLPFQRITILDQRFPEQLKNIYIRANTPEEIVQSALNLVREHRLIINDLSEAGLTDLFTRFREKSKTQSFLSLEINYRSQRYGSIVLHQCHYERIWTEAEIEFLNIISTQLGAAFYQNALHEHEAIAKQEADLANHRKDQFLAKMSHELRTPLNVIIGYSEMLEKGFAGDLQEKQQKYIHNILTSGYHLLNLVNDILDISKIAAGKVSLFRTWFSISSLVEEVVSAMHDLAFQSQVTLHYEILPSLDLVYADISRLRQVFLNLLSNAIKFNRPGGTVEIKLYPEEDRWMVCEITDTGIGIPKDKIPHLFTEFYQVDESYARRQEGTGLGLAMTKHLIELHGGFIDLQSEPGRGTCVTFKLPIHPENNTQGFEEP